MVIIPVLILHVVEVQLCVCVLPSFLPGGSLDSHAHVLCDAIQVSTHTHVIMLVHTHTHTPHARTHAHTPHVHTHTHIRTQNAHTHAHR